MHSFVRRIMGRTGNSTRTTGPWRPGTPKRVALLATLSLAACGGEREGAESPGGRESGDVAADGGHAADPASPGSGIGDFPEARDRSLAEISADEARHDEEYWAPEVRSETYREAFVQLWDDLHAGDDRWAVLGRSSLGEFVPGRLGTEESLGARLIHRPIVAETAPLTAEEKAAWLDELQERFTLESFEFIPRRFVDGSPAKTVLAVELGLAPRPGSGETRMLQIQVDVEVTWSDLQDAFLNYVPVSLRVLGGDFYQWSGPPAFEEALVYENLGPQVIPPICVYDVDGDGWTDIVYPQTNVLFHNLGDFRFEQVDFAAFPLRSYYDALFGDFDGDGVRDFLAAGIGEGDAQGTPSLYLFRSDADGAFTNPPEKVYAAAFSSQLCLAAGDIDADGDLDLYIGTYLPPFVGGQVPTPFHDSNDGLPGTLLLNDGSGQFVEGIEGSGLEEFRFRRTFRVSFVDLDQDGDLDLLQTNDFAGTAIFWNDGTGRFELADSGEDAAKGVDEPESFGMAHTFGDYDGDGETDVYVTGMYSYTVRRFEESGLGRPDRPDVDAHRMVLGFGNRMYMGDGLGRFRQPPFRDSVANTGWSWGVTSFDLDNDGDLDLFVANGHLSGNSIRDYDSRYWRHDVYQVGSKPDPVKSAYFLDKMGALGRASSWAGYEQNRLLMNRVGDASSDESAFVSVGHALGLGDVVDSRHVVSEDFDRDGRTDLLVGFKDGLGEKKGFRVFRNLWPDPGNWISITLRDAPGTSVFGARIVVEVPGATYSQLVVAGDSFFAQHSNRRVFGLGSASEVLRVTVIWPGGKMSVLDAPEIAEDHVVVP